MSYYEGGISVGDSHLVEDRWAYSLIVTSYPYRAPMGDLSFYGEGLILLPAWAESTRLPLSMSHVRRGVRFDVVLTVLVRVLAGDRARVLFFLLSRDTCSGSTAYRMIVILATGWSMRSGEECRIYYYNTWTIFKDV